jgi:hypothetical protein
MVNLNSTGFRPADRKPSEELRFDVDASSSTAMFVGDVVMINGAGSVRPATADIGTSAIGVVVALYDLNGIPIGSPGAAVTTKFLTGSVAGKALVALAIPGKRFIAQSQTGQTPTAADVFATTDHVAGAGDETVSRSGHELDFSDLNSGGQFLILGRVVAPDNTFGANVDLYVTFNESIFGPVDKSVGV